MAILRACPYCGKPNETRACPEHGGSHQRHGSTRRWRNVRAQVIGRDGGCTHPGCTTDDPLEVHHMDGNPANDALANLTTLCTTHHLAIEGRTWRR